MFSGRFREFCYIIQDFVCHIHILHFALKFQDFLSGDDSPRKFQRIDFLTVAEKLYQALVIRVSHAETDHKTVKLGFR